MWSCGHEPAKCFLSSQSNPSRRRHNDAVSALLLLPLDPAPRLLSAFRTREEEDLEKKIKVVHSKSQLKLEGVHIDEEETLTDVDFLNEIMEIREAVEEAPDSQALNQIQSQMQEQLKQWSNNFSKAFGSLNFEEAVKAIRRMTYYERANEEIIKRQ